MVATVVASNYLAVIIGQSSLWQFVEPSPASWPDLSQGASISLVDTEAGTVIAQGSALQSGASVTQVVTTNILSSYTGSLNLQSQIQYALQATISGVITTLATGVLSAFSTLPSGIQPSSIGPAGSSNTSSQGVPLLRSQLLRLGDFGDSLSLQLMGSQYPASDSGVASKATTMPFFGGNMFYVAAILAGVRFTRVAAHSGDSSGQLVPFIASDVLASSGGGQNQYLPAPNVVSVLMGTDDDITVANAVAIAMNNIKTTWNQLIGAGIGVIPTTVPPRSDNGQNGWPAYSSAGTYPNRLIFNAALNTEIVKEASALGLLIYRLDLILGNGSGGFSGAVGVLSNDGIHPNNAGYFYAGQRMAPTLAELMGQTVPLSASDTDPVHIAGQTTVLQLNGGVLVTAPTANQPDGYGTSHSIGATFWVPTFTTQPSDGTNAHGNWSQLSIAATSNQVTSLNDYLSFCEITYNQNSWVPVPGNRMLFACRVATLGLVAGNCNWSAYLICNQSFNGQSIGSLVVGAANQMDFDIPLSQYPGGGILCGEFIVPPNTTSMQLSIRVQPNATATAMSGIIQIAQPTIIDLDGQGIA